MNLRHLEVFHAIMQTGSVTAAAQLLNVTQPAISNVLRHAEQRIKFKLFERVGGRLQPTAEAQNLFPDVEDIFGRVETLGRTIFDLQNGLYGHLAIAASPTFVNAYLPDAVAQMRIQAPDARFEIQVLPSANAIEEKVARREVDMGLVYAQVNNAEVQVEEIAVSRVFCALPVNSHLCSREVIHAEDLRDQVVIGTGKRSRVWATITREHSLRNLPHPDLAIEVNSLHVACLMAARGAGIGLVDTATVHQYRNTDVVFRPYSPEIKLKVCLIRPKNRAHSKLAQRLTRNLVEVVEGSNLVL